MAVRVEPFIESAQKENERLADKFEKYFDDLLLKQMGSTQDSFSFNRPSGYSEAVNDILRKRYVLQGGWKDVYIQKYLKWGGKDSVVFKK